METILNDENFALEVLQSELPVLVDFWADWCPPCRMVAPVVEEVARKYAGRLKVGKLNVDENPITTAKYGIRSIPTFIFFKAGAVFDQVVGAMSLSDLEARIKKLLHE